MITITAVIYEASKSVLADITCYACNKKRYLVRDYSEKLKKVVSR